MYSDKFAEDDVLGHRASPPAGPCRPGRAIEHAAATIAGGRGSIYELAFLWGIGPRVEEACVDHIKGFAYSAPYEDLKLTRTR